MRLNKLELRSFRSYEAAELSCAPGVNLIVGDNAQGKTNLLEAIVYLGSGRSFRTQKGAELVRFGADFGEITGQITAQEREQTLRAVIFPGGRSRQLWRNGVRKKSAAELDGVLRTVLFCPEDLMVLKTGAAARRRLGDSTLCQLRPNYDAALAEYTRILEQKSRILRDWRENPRLLELLPDFNTRLCQVGALLIRYRGRFYESLGQEAAVFHSAFSGGKEALTLEYRTVSTVTNPQDSAEVIFGQLWEHLLSHERAELDSGQCLTGPHKDDFTVRLSGLDIKSFGSQGQTRTAAISLKLAQRELLRRDSGEEPVLLLDDVLSELDPGRQNFVLNQITQGQVFITCCEPGRFTQLGQTVTIENGKIHC